MRMIFVYIYFISILLHPTYLYLLLQTIFYTIKTNIYDYKYIIQNVHYFLNHKLRMMYFIDNLYSSESNGKYLIYTAKTLLMYELLCTINTIL